MTDYIGPHESMPIIRARVHGEVSDRLQILADGTFLKGDGKGVLSPSAEGSRGLGGSNGHDDTTAIQNALNGAGSIQGRPGENYVITAPLVIKANTLLDMRGCTVTLKAGTNGNMLQNAAVAAARSVIDAAMTSADATLTSATAAFTGGDVGKAVTVVGAGTNGKRLVTTIQSVTNATTAVLAANAAATVSNAWVTIGSRDANITLIGGVWDRGANVTLPGNIGYTANSIRLRRVDNVRVCDVEVASTAGKYGVNLGDVWNFQVRGIRGRTTFSDIVHINGPARHGAIRDTHAEYAGDDVVSLTASDFNTVATMADTAGDIADVVVDGVTADYGVRRGAIAVAGTAPAAFGGRAVCVSNVTIRNVRGKYANPAVSIGGDYQDAATTGGTYSGILVEDVKASPGGSPNVPLVFLSEGTFEDVTARDLVPDAGSSQAVQIGGTNTAQTSTVRRIVIDRVAWRGGFSPNGAVNVTRGSVDTMIVNAVQIKSPNTDANIVLVGSSMTLNRLVLHGCELEENTTGGTASLVRAAGTSITLGYVEISDCHTKNVSYPLAWLNTTTRLKATNVHAEGASAVLRAEAAAVLTVEAYNIDSNADGVSIAAGGSVRSLALGLRTDVTLTGFQKNAGDMAFNTNAGNALAAVGPAVANGTNWKHLYSGTTA